MDVKLDFLKVEDGELIDPSFNIRVLSAFKSHLKVLKHFRDNVKGDRILIMEDDIIFHKDFHNLFEIHSNNLPVDSDIWYLGGFEWRTDLIVNNNPHFYKPVGFTAGLFAYSVNRNIIDLFIEKLETFYYKKMAVDFAVFRFMQNGQLPIYVSKPNLIGHDYIVSTTQGKVSDDTRVWFPIEFYDY
jgi:GR25 family glycosyltransferase involved in LPS biosynthesis